MKKIILLVALIAVGCFVASRLLKSDEDAGNEGTQTYSEMTDAKDTTDVDEQPEVESPAEDTVASEAAG